MQSDSLYTGMAGLQAINAKMQALASNLANAQTPGYAALQAVTQPDFYQGSNAPAGADAAVLNAGPDTTQGAPRETGDPMNVALSGDAWLQVQTSNGPALTRDGSLAISAAGILTDSAGNPVLGTNGQPISLPNLQKLQIGTDGAVSGIPANSTSGQAQQYGQIALIATPKGTLTQLSGTLYAPLAGVTLSPSANGGLQQGYLNESNVDPTQAMMQLIDDSRSYQMQTQLMHSQSTASADLNTLVAQA